MVRRKDYSALVFDFVEGTALISEKREILKF